MVNVGLGWSSVLGILLAASGLALYFLRSFRPKLARDHDIVFAAIALLCGGILFFQGWRQDPILQFGQFLLTGSAVFFAVESVRLRGIATEQAKRNAPIVDDERPVRPIYRAELDDVDTFEDRTVQRRIRGSSNGRSGWDDGDEAPRRRSARNNADDRYGSSDNARRRRPRSEDDSVRTSGYSSYATDDDLGDRPGRSRTATSSRSGNASPSGTSRRPRPADEPSRSRNRSTSPDVPPSEYVDYRPVNTDDESDNWGEE